MAHYSSKIIKPLNTLLTVSVIVGSVALLGLAIHLVRIPFTHDTTALPLLVLLSTGVNLSVPLFVSSLGIYVVYSLLVIATLLLALLFLNYLRIAVGSLKRRFGFVDALASTVQKMGIVLLVFAYARQIVLWVAFSYGSGPSSDMLSFTFSLVPSEVAYALALFILAKVFSYALELQIEYDQTV